MAQQRQRSSVGVERQTRCEKHSLTVWIPQNFALCLHAVENPPVAAPATNQPHHLTGHTSTHIHTLLLASSPTVRADPGHPHSSPPVHPMYPVPVMMLLMDVSQAGSSSGRMNCLRGGPAALGAAPGRMAAVGRTPSWSITCRA